MPQKKNICDLKIILRLTIKKLNIAYFPKQNKNKKISFCIKLISSDPAQTAQEMVYKKYIPKRKKKTTKTNLKINTLSLF